MEFTKNRREFKVNLTAANKYMTKLKSHQSSNVSTVDQWGRKTKVANGPVTRLNITQLMVKYMQSPENSQLTSDIESSRKYQQDQAETSRSVSLDISMLKNAIFRANGLGEIDSVLTEIDYLTNLKTEYNQIIKGCGEDIDVNQSMQMMKKSYETSNTYQQVEVNIWNRTELMNEIKKINKRINELEMKRDKLNATTEVTVFLSEKSVEVLGI